MRVAIAEAGFTWTVPMESSPVTRALNAFGARLPTGCGIRPLYWQLWDLPQAWRGAAESFLL